MDLRLLWFILLGCLLAGYAILDGFDLGVGILHLGAGTDRDRRVFMNAIGPLWDGNVVWLVTFGGALFAAFPEAYATAFSGYYSAFMLLLFALIFRGVSLEFRGKREEPLWRGTWDVLFSGSSTLATFLYGVTVGSSMHGVPLDADHEFVGHLGDLLTPYALGVGLMAVATFALHGSIYLYLKTEGPLQQQVRGWVWRAFAVFVVLYALITVWTVIEVPRALHRFETAPWLGVVPLLNVLAIANIPRAMVQGRPLYAFISSSCTIAAFVLLFGLDLYPNLITSTLDPAWSLTVDNAASTDTTLAIMTVVAVLGMPFVLSYTGIVYWVFRGKVRLEKASY